MNFAFHPHFLSLSKFFFFRKKEITVQIGVGATYEILHFAEREIGQIAGVIAHPEEGGLLGQLG